jgi:hypothetical protein
MTTIDARLMTDKEYAASKANMTDWRKKPTQPAAQYSREKLEFEIKAFEESGLKSAFTSNTSSAATPPQPKTPTDGSPSALAMSEEAYQRSKRDIGRGKVPSLNASPFIPV